MLLACIDGWVGGGVFVSSRGLCGEAPPRKGYLFQAEGEYCHLGNQKGP